MPSKARTIDSRPYSAATRREPASAKRCASVGSFRSLVTASAKRSGLPFDCILSAEVFRAYKPDPAAYQGVGNTFDVPHERVMLVAAHHDDLAGARACGLRTAYVERPLEFGAAQSKDVAPRPQNDLHSRDLSDLADQLGC